MAHDESRGGNLYTMSAFVASNRKEGDDKKEQANLKKNWYNQSCSA